MIENALQYKVTQKQAELFRKALRHMDATPTAELAERLIQAEREAMQSQLADLEAELAAYEKEQAQ